MQLICSSRSVLAGDHFVTISSDGRLLRCLVVANGSLDSFEVVAAGNGKLIVGNVGVIGNVGVVQVSLLGHLPGTKSSENAVCGLMLKSGIAVCRGDVIIPRRHWCRVVFRKELEYLTYLTSLCASYAILLPNSFSLVFESLTKFYAFQDS